MTTKKEETASFMLRFNQKIFQSDSGESEIQWRGIIRHIQGGDEERFSKFEEVISFIQGKLTDLTIIAMEDKSIEEQKGILSKSFELWKKMASEAPKIVAETIKDPKKQVAHLQDQIQDQILQVKEEINQKLEIGNWMGSSKGDLKEIEERLDTLTKEISGLHKKIDKLSK
jgi:uncharacterized coiled-coil DUF342 family protein